MWNHLVGAMQPLGTSLRFEYTSHRADRSGGGGPVRYRPLTLAAAVLGTLLALPGWPQTPPASALPAAPQTAAPQTAAPQTVPVVEPGKPMRFETVTPPAAAEAPAADAEPCDLESPQDRRTTPSKKCMRCHDGSRASNAATGHRFDIEYVSYGKELRPDPEKLNPKVVLAGGKVTCLSCHEPLSNAPFRLAAPTNGPSDKRLCAACHIR